MAIAKINGIAKAAIASLNGVAEANVHKWNGLLWDPVVSFNGGPADTDYGWWDSASPSYTNTRATGRIIGTSGAGSPRTHEGVVRFPGITVAQGATIAAANLYLYFNATGVGTAKFRFYGLDEDDGACPADLTEWDADLASNLTTANVYWEPNQYSEKGYFTSPELKTIIQEIVNRGSWSSGNAIVLFILEEGTVPGYAYRSCWLHTDADGGDTAIPRLDITV